MQNIFCLVSADTINNIIIIALTISNLVFITLFILSVIKQNRKLDMPLDEIKRADKEIIGSGYEKQAHQTNKTAMQTGAEKQFIMVETEKNDGFYVKNKQTKETIAFCKTKAEALEIIKSLKREA